MQLPPIVYVSLVIGFSVVIYALPDFKNKVEFISWGNLMVLTFTLIVLVWYTYDTNRIAQQTIDTNLRPIVLVQGAVDWTKLVFTSGPGGTILGNPIQFFVLKNVALHFRGFVVVDNKKYDLVFNGDNSASTKQASQFFKIWDWISPNNILYAIYDPSIQPTPTESRNGIFLEYSDTEGNLYHTIDDANYKQSSVRGSLKF